MSIASDVSQRRDSMMDSSFRQVGPFAKPRQLGRRIDTWSETVLIRDAYPLFK